MRDAPLPSTRAHPRRLDWVLLMILGLALLRGGVYASYLPPWGLVDEEQHLDYIESLAVKGAIPVVGQTYLSPDIVASLFATRRWEVFHWPSPPSRAPESMGLEGHSYEGYQPPLAYLVLVPLYWLLPGDILLKLAGLRWALVLLSLLTVWVAYRLTAELLPEARWLPPAVALLLVLLPERTMAVSRLNNDVLLEVIAAGFVWVLTRAWLHGLTVRRAQWLGLLLGLGVLTKTSMLVVAVLLPLLFWSKRRDAQFWRCLMWTAGLALALVLPLAARNLWLYGDLTGFAGFEKIAGFQPRPVTGSSLLSAAVDLFRYTWVIWWQGAAVGTNPILRVFYICLLALTGISLFGLGRWFWPSLRQRALDPARQVMLAYAALTGCCALSVVAAYFTGAVPVIQGRFLLPVIVPLLVLFGWGLLSSGRWGPLAVLGAAVVLLLTDALSLFGNLLPYYYYWSAFAGTAASPLPMPHAWPEAWALFYSRFLADKPAGLRPILWLLLPLNGAWLAASIVLLVKAKSPSGPWSGWKALADQSSG